MILQSLHVLFMHSVVLPSLDSPVVLPSLEYPVVLPSLDYPAVLPSLDYPVWNQVVLPSLDYPVVIPSLEYPVVLPSLDYPAVLPSLDTQSGLPSRTTQSGLPSRTTRSGLPSSTTQPGLPGVMSTQLVLCNKCNLARSQWLVKLLPEAILQCRPSLTFSSWSIIFITSQIVDWFIWFLDMISCINFEDWVDF